MQLEDGVLIVLPRDEAKAFFGHRQDDARLQFIGELMANDSIPKLSCNSKWQAVHDLLAGIELESSVLGQAILGGRPLHQGDDYHVCLVRPDVVGFICDQAKQLTEARCGDLWPEVSELVATYGKAAEVGGAMVFVSKK